MSAEREPSAGRLRPTLGQRLPVILMALITGAIFIAGSLGYNPWDAFFVNPLINLLILFNNAFLGAFGVAIIVFTVFMRLVTLPLTIRQFQSTWAMTALQPRLQEIQRKYKDPKRRQEETLKLYREAGVNPLGCLLPMLVQFPVWIALYHALNLMVRDVPEAIVGLSQRLYPWRYLYDSLPLEQRFLWLHLGQPDATFILPILVGVTTYLQQRVSTAPTTVTSREQQQMNQMLTWMMPLMFVWFTLLVPSGLGLYWLVSNVISVFISYFVYGARGINWRQVLLPMPTPAATPPKPTSSREAPQEDVRTSPPRKRESHARRRRGKR